MTLLGTGTPFLELDRCGSAILVEVGATCVLIDAGRGVTTQLIRAGRSPKDIDAIFITHHHADHIGDLGDILIAAWHAGRDRPVHVYGPSGTRAIVAALLDIVYAGEIAFSLALERRLGSPLVDINSLVAVHDVTPGILCTGGGLTVAAETVEHGSTLLSPHLWQCLGYRLEAGGRSIAVSGDTIVCAGLEKLARNADLLVMCCYLADDEMTSPAFEFLASQVIASSGQIGRMAAQSGVTQLVLTHFRPKSDPLMQSIMVDIRRDYSGDIVLGSDLMRFTIR